MCNVLKYSKIFQNGSVRLRYGCVAVVVIFSIYLKPVQYIADVCITVYSRYIVDALFILNV